MPNPDLAGASASALMRAIPCVALVTATLCAVGPLSAQQLTRQEIQHHGLEQVPAALAMFHQYLSLRAGPPRARGGR